MSPSVDVEDRCLSEVRKLEKCYDRITSCRVVLAKPRRPHRQGSPYGVRIDLEVPGGEIVIDREPVEPQRAEELSTAIREAFDRARRRLEGFVSKRRKSEREPNGWS